MKSFRRGKILGAIAIGSLGVAAVADAALTTKSHNETISPNQVGTITAKCARGSEVISHGFQVNDFDPDFVGAATYVAAAQRKGVRRAKTTALNIGGQPGDVTTEAYCAKPRPRLAVVKSDPVPVPSLGKRTVSARCPRGSEAVGGGSASPQFALSGPRVYTFASWRSGKRTWKVSGGEVNNVSGGTLVALAYCDKSEPGLATKRVSVDVPAPYGSRGTAKPRCARGDIAQSGGFKILTFDPNYSPETSTVYPLTSLRVGRRTWKAVGHQDNGGSVGRLKAFAYCRG